MKNNKVTTDKKEPWAFEVLVMNDKMYCRTIEAMRRKLGKETISLISCYEALAIRIKYFTVLNIKTLHSVMRSFREFRDQKKYSEHYVYKLFLEVENELLSNEYYELMPRYLRAKKKILKELKHPISKEKS